MIEQPNPWQRPVANPAAITAEPEAVVLLPSKLSPGFTAQGCRLDHRRAALPITRQWHSQLHASQLPLRDLNSTIRVVANLSITVAVDAVQAVTIATAIRLRVVEVGRRSEEHTSELQS